MDFNAFLGYPGAFGIDRKNEAGDWPAILNKVEEVVVEKGGSGRMGTWAYSRNYTLIYQDTYVFVKAI